VRHPGFFPHPPNIIPNHTFWGLLKRGKKKTGEKLKPKNMWEKTPSGTGPPKILYPPKGVKNQKF